MTKKQFLLAFVATVALLAVVKWTLLPPSLYTTASQGGECEQVAVSGRRFPAAEPMASPEETDDGPARHRPSRIRSVADYRAAFPDSQSVQIVAAQRWGVKPVRNRTDAEQRKKELVYVGESPYYHVDPLQSSIPYLVPRASVLLRDIGRAFYDSLYQKGIPTQQVIVTSVLRSMDDVARLRRRNGNATEQSCHLYGTTFDISYNRYQAVERPVRNDTLKWVLSEVLRDKRQEGRCYIKYEVKQGCFHMTVR